ncbi:MAG: DegV family protein [Ruminococcaceae bacterium]|nr:DegV family protein [Oscillospiraceae bacterium]
MSFVLFTDSSANLTTEIVEKFNIEVIPMIFLVNGVEHRSYKKGENVDIKQYYDMMRNKEHIKTSLLSPETYQEAFRPFLEDGKDILYIGFSSGLSGTYQSSAIAAEMLREEYPQRKIVTWDSLCASMGEGLMVYYAAKMKEEGKSIDEILSWLDENKLNLCHWFTVDDLFFLKRGGRVSGATAVIGSALGIKPVLHVDDNGKLVPVSKVRGRKQAMHALVSKMEETSIEPEKQTVFISHGDCIDDAEYVAKCIKEKFGTDDIVINYIDPVIGAHSGPGTLALFFLGNER